MTLFYAHLLSWSAVLLLLDAALWHFSPFSHRAPRVGVRLALFLAFSALVINAGVSPLQAPLFADDRVAQLGATALGILWWLYAARVLTEVIGLVLMRRIGHSGRLLQDVIGALVFLIAIVAAAGVGNAPDPDVQAIVDAAVAYADDHGRESVYGWLMAALGLGVDVRVVARAGLRVTGAVTLSLAALGALSLGLIRILGLA